MSAPSHPSIEHFLAPLSDPGSGRPWGQVLVTRIGAGFELRHAADTGTDPARLRTVSVPDLRNLASATADGRFRPLKSTPDLVAGWVCPVPRPADLAIALDHLYPGSLADRWAADIGRATPARFETVVARQLGRAKILQELSGPGLAATVAAACTPVACLKHRVWTADGLPADPAPSGSRESGGAEIPCLEPCPLFLSFARACAGTERGSTVPGHFAPDDLATLAAALRHVLEHPPAGLRLGEVTSPLHPWRVSRLLVRHRETWSQAAPPTDEPDE